MEVRRREVCGSAQALTLKKKKHLLLLLVSFNGVRPYDPLVSEL